MEKLHAAQQKYSKIHCWSIKTPTKIHLNTDSRNNWTLVIGPSSPKIDIKNFLLRNDLLFKEFIKKKHLVELGKAFEFSSRIFVVVTVI